MGYCYEAAFGLIGMSFEGEIYSRLEIGVMQIDAKWRAFQSCYAFIYALLCMCYA